MYKSDLYRLVTIDNGQTDTASIIKIFSEMEVGNLKCDISLLNYFNEVPVNYGATICTIGKDSVDLSVNEHQAVVIKLDNSTIIKSNHFPKELGVHCYAAYVSVPKKMVILHNFAYAQIRSERREAVRVSIIKPISVNCSYKDISLDGTIVDISATGIAIHTPDVPAIDTDQPVRLSFSLMDTLLTVDGSFVRTAKSENYDQLYIFQMKPDRKHETVIGQFMYKRQIEIIQDLRDGLSASCAESELT